MRKDWFAIFKVRVKTYINSFWTAVPEGCCSAGLELPKDIYKLIGKSVVRKAVCVCDWTMTKLCMWIVYTLSVVFEYMNVLSSW